MAKNKEIIKYLETQMHAVNKYHKALGYTFSDENQRKVILKELLNYIKYFEQHAEHHKDGDRIRFHIQEALFKGIDFK